MDVFIVTVVIISATLSFQIHALSTLPQTFIFDITYCFTSSLPALLYFFRIKGIRILFHYILLPLL